MLQPGALPGPRGRPLIQGGWDELSKTFLPVLSAAGSAILPMQATSIVIVRPESDASGRRRPATSGLHPALPGVRPEVHRVTAHFEQRAPPTQLASNCKRRSPGVWTPEAASSEPALVRTEAARLSPARGFPGLVPAPEFRSGGLQSRIHFSNSRVPSPQHVLSVPRTSKRSVSGHSSLFPVAYRPSVPQVVGGSRAVSTPAYVAGPTPRQPQPNNRLGPAQPAS